MKKLLHDIKASLYGKDYVGHFRERKVESGAWHLFKLCLFEAVVFAIMIAFAAIPAIAKFVDGGFIAEHYPDGLEITIKDGIASTNVEEPYFVTVEDEQGPTNIVAIDTGATDALAAAEEYGAIVLLTRDRLVFSRPDRAEVRAFNLKEMGDMDISEESVMKVAREVVPWIYGGAAVLFPIAIFLIAFFSTLFYLAVALLLALLTLLAGKIRKLDLDYKDSYVITLYALTLPILADTLTDLFWYNNPFLVTVLLFVVALAYNLRAPAVSEKGQADSQASS